MHSIERAWERYGLELTPADIGALERQIEDRRSVLVRLEENHTEVHLVDQHGVAMVAVWAVSENGRFMRIVTFLPEESVMRGNQARRFAQPADRELRGGRHRHKQRRRRPLMAYAGA